MTTNPSRFAELLTRAVNRIHAEEDKPKTIVRDELGYAARREGRTAVDYWCRGNGHIPAELSSVEGLAREIARRGGLSKPEMEAFLASADYLETKRLCGELYAEDRSGTSVTASSKPELVCSADTQPPPLHVPVGEPEREVVPLRSEERHVVSESVSGPARPPDRAAIFRLPLRVRWALLLLGLGATVLTGAMAWARLPTADKLDKRGQIQLIDAGAQRVRVESSGRVLVSGDTVPTYTPITVTFRVLNNGVGPVIVHSLTIGVRGPGVTCRDSNKQRWSALDVPFPSATDLTLRPGEVYEYRGNRALYLPGTYFLEPVEQDAAVHWGGIPPFTCLDLTVVEAKP